MTSFYCPLSQRPPHSGRSISENCLNPLVLSVTDAAKDLGVVPHTHSRVLNSDAAISPEMAGRLEKGGCFSTEFWLRRQMFHDLEQARQGEQKIRVERWWPPATVQAG